MRACLDIMITISIMHTLDKMRTILAIVVISCFFAVAMSQSDCATRVTDLSNCITMLGTNTQDRTAFCNECGNQLISYYQDCTNGVGVDAVRAGIIVSYRIKMKAFSVAIFKFVHRNKDCVG